MRKLTYHLIVALLTFAAGSVIFLYFQRSADVPSSVEVSASTVPTKQAARAKITLLCSDELLQQISNDLLHDDDFVDELEFDNAKTFNCSDNFRTKRIDLNRDGKPEFVVHGLEQYLCSITGNCAFWIYRQTEKGYERILDTGDVHQFYFQHTFSNGYRDVITAMHSSATDSSLSLYKFDGSQYQLKGCMERTYSYKDKQGHFRERRTPLITSVKCQSEE